MTDDRALDPAFRRLRRALLQRRLYRLDLRLRAEIALLAIVVAGFVFWQERIPFDAARRARGPWAVAGALGTLLGILAVGSAAVVAASHRSRLRAELPGPAWLALPVPAARLLDHMAWESRFGALWGVALAPGLVAAAYGFLPLWALLAMSMAFLAMTWLLARAATAVAASSAVRARRAGRSGDPALDLLLEARPLAARRRLKPAGWRRLPRWLALWAKDARLTVRPTPARVRLFGPLVAMIASCVVWLLPLEPPFARLIAFGAALVAAALLAEFLIALGGADPPGLLRVLPVGVGAVWLGRVMWALLGAAVLVAGQAVFARAISGPAQQVLMVWLGAAALAIGLLGVHYGITLGANAPAAQRLLTLTLAISMAASLMIPLVGWIVLLTAVVHSARRVPRWARIEDER